MAFRLPGGTGYHTPGIITESLWPKENDGMAMLKECREFAGRGMLKR